jgi:hypothetical protein
MNDVARVAQRIAPTTGRASFGALVEADRRRFSGTWILPLTGLGPLGVTVLGVVYCLLQRDFVAKEFASGKMSGWLMVTNIVGMIHILALGLGAALLASMIVDVEHRSDTWKQLFGLPVSRTRVYIVKFLWGAGLLAVSSALMVVGYAGIMVWQHWGPLPWADLATAGWLPWLAVLPLLAFQLLLSTAFKNQAVPLTAGVLVPMFAMGMSPMPAWLIWRLPSEAEVAVAGGVIAGGPGEALSWLSPLQIGVISAAWVIVLVTAGALLIARREVR